MSQHFLISRAAKTLSLAQVFRMTVAEGETAFRNIRWAGYQRRARLPLLRLCGGL